MKAARMARLGWVVSAACGLLVMASVRADEKSKTETKQIKAKDLTLTVPKTWKQQEPKSRFRVAEVAVPPAEGDEHGATLAVFWFRGGGGGIKANVRRWINQFQSKGREVKTTKGESPQGEYVLVDVRGTYNQPVGPPVLGKTRPMPDARMLAVILITDDRQAYYLKLPGPEKTVSAAADAFRASFGADAEKEEKYELGDEG